MKHSKIPLLFLCAAVQLLITQKASAQINGTWTGNAAGLNWSGTGNWSSGTVPGGAGSTVNFTNNISGNRTVNIDTTSRTVGVLNIGDTNASHGVTLAATGGASLIFNNGGVSELNFVSSGGTNTVSAPIALSDSLTIRNSSSSPQTISGAISATSAGTKTITNSGTGSGSVNINGVISDNLGTVSVTQNSATSLLTLGAANLYTGTTTLTSGRLRIGNNSAFGTSVLALNGGTLSANSAAVRTLANSAVLGGDVTFGDLTDSGQVTITGSTTLTGNRTITVLNALQLSGRVTGAYSLTKQGNGDLILSSSTSDYTGGFTLDAGRVRVVSNRGFGFGNLTLNSGTVASFDTVARTFSNDIIIGGNVTLGDAVNSGTLTFTGSNTLTGNRTLTVESTVVLSGAIGQSGGARALTKAGAGNLILTASNTYSGNTTVSAGTLVLSGSGNIGQSGVVQVATGAVLNAAAVTGGFQLQSGQRLENKGTFVGSLTALNGSTYAPGNSPGIALQDGNLALNTGSSFEWELIGNTSSGAGTNFDRTDFLSGGLTIQTGVSANLVFDDAGSSVLWSDAFWNSDQQWLVFSNGSSLSTVTDIFTTINVGFDSAGVSLSAGRAGASFYFTNNGNDVYLNYAAVPEPSTWALMIGGLLLVFGCRRFACNS